MPTTTTTPSQVAEIIENTTLYNSDKYDEKQNYFYYDSNKNQILFGYGTDLTAAQINADQSTKNTYIQSLTPALTSAISSDLWTKIGNSPSQGVADSLNALLKHDIGAIKSAADGAVTAGLDIAAKVAQEVLRGDTVGGIDGGTPTVDWNSLSPGWQDALSSLAYNGGAKNFYGKNSDGTLKDESALLNALSAAQSGTGSYIDAALELANDTSEGGPAGVRWTAAALGAL